jgi:hypothetical protein
MFSIKLRQTLLLFFAFFATQVGYTPVVDVGFKNLQAHSMRVHQIVLGHLLNHINENLTVIYDPLRSVAGKILQTHRWAYHDEVMKAYALHKEYLDETDISPLENVNMSSGNSDVFGLLAHDENFYFLDMPLEEIRRRLVRTIQISYWGDRNYFRPTLRGVMLSAELPIYDKEDEFPFEYRIVPELLGAFREKFYKFFVAKKTGELSRYASFANVPKPIRDRFVLRAFDKAIERKLKALVISVDTKTQEAFRPYGFSFYSELPTGQTDEKEFVYYYIIIDGTDFRRAYSRLSISAGKVETLTGDRG